MINSTAYYNDFWNEMRGKQAVTDNRYNNRESKTNAYHLPGESNKKYMAVLQKESAVRQLATVVNATRSDSRLWTFDCEGQAEWGDMVNLEGMDNEDDYKMSRPNVQKILYKSTFSALPLVCSSRRSRLEEIRMSMDGEVVL